MEKKQAKLTAVDLSISLINAHGNCHQNGGSVGQEEALLGNYKDAFSGLADNVEDEPTKKIIMALYDAAVEKRRHGK